MCLVHERVAGRFQLMAQYLIQTAWDKKWLIPQSLQSAQVMGGSSSSDQMPPKNSLLLDWETIDHLRDFNIVRNIKNGTIAQVRKYKLNPAYDPAKEIQIYKFRQQSQHPIVKSYGAELLQKVSRKKTKAEGNANMCSSNNHMGAITQRIPHTLQSLPQLSFQESLYVLRESLQGYQILFPKSGPVHVNARKIGVNDFGKLKVWINQDWALNHPSDEINSLHSTRNTNKLDREYNLIAPQFRDQKEMVENIIDVVEEKCQYGRFPPLFAQELQTHAHSFATAKAYLQEFLHRNRLFIPSQIHPKTILLTRKGLQQLQQRHTEINYQAPSNLGGGLGREGGHNMRNGAERRANLGVWRE